MTAAGAPREALGEWMRVARSAEGYEAVLEDHFGAAQAADLLARCALAALDANGGGALCALHADWLAPARPGVPIALRVERLAASPARLLVTAAHGGLPVGRVVAGFRDGDSALAYQDARLPSGLPEPDSLPTTVEYARKEGWPEEYAGGPVEFRRVGPRRPDRAAGESTDHVEWLRLRSPLPRDARVELAALVFLAAFYDHWEFEWRVGERFDYAGFEVLSQTVSLHRAQRPDGWLLLRASSGVASEGRALARRELFAQDGALAASVACAARVAER